MSNGTIDAELEILPDIGLEDVRTGAEADACRQLYLSIIELAVKDYRFLQRFRSNSNPSKSDVEKRRKRTEDGDPREFFESAWFEKICDYIGANPQLIRERLAQEDADITSLLDGETRAKVDLRPGSLDIADLPPKVGDVYFREGRYFIGSQVSSVKGKVTTWKGRLLVHFLNNLDTRLTLEDLASGLDNKIENIRVPLKELYGIVNYHSEVFAMDVGRNPEGLLSYCMHYWE